MGEVDEESRSQHVALHLTTHMDLLGTHAHSLKSSGCCRLRILGAMTHLTAAPRGVHYPVINDRPHSQQFHNFTNIYTLKPELWNRKEILPSPPHPRDPDLRTGDYGATLCSNPADHPWAIRGQGGRHALSLQEAARSLCPCRERNMGQKNLVLRNQSPYKGHRLLLSSGLSVACPFLLSLYTAHILLSQH